MLQRQGNSAGNNPDVIPFAKSSKGCSPYDNDQLDEAGQTILQLLHRAAGVAEENSRSALETAQKLSHQLRAAEDRIAELEAEVTAYQETADRADEWLHRVYTEIEEQFVRGRDDHYSTSRRAQNAGRRAD